jgi:hypothetical protein
MPLERPPDMIADSVLETLQQLTAEELQKLLQNREADTKALRVLWRAALAREREERRQARVAGRD